MPSGRELGRIVAPLTLDALFASREVAVFVDITLHALSVHFVTFLSSFEHLSGSFGGSSGILRDSIGI